MKNLFILLSLIFCLTDIKAQTYVNIPDANFVAWLQANVPSAMNGNQMNTSDLAVKTRTVVDVKSLSISDLTGIQYFDSLKTLNCGTDACNHTPNPITFLPTLPSTLRELICQSNLLTSLPTLPGTLKKLVCYNIPITSLPILPNSLEELTCIATSIISLPQLPNHLIALECYYNQLTNIPNLPPTLSYLGCSSNFISNLPALPSSLENLNCSNNLITNLPTLPVGLYELACSNNQLTSLPVLPNFLTIAICDGNQITSLPTLPNYLSLLDCHDNNISCFAPFNSLSFIAIHGNPFTCLPNYISDMDPLTLAYPLCSIGNPNGCIALATTGLTEEKENTSSLFPNPSNGTFTIELNTKEKQFVQLFDIAGNVVLSQTIENGSTTIDGSHLAASIYNINIKGENSVTNKKMVIVK